MLEKSLKLNPQSYAAVKAIHEGVGELLEEMSPTDDTPFELTGKEAMEKVLTFVGGKILGN